MNDTELLQQLSTIFHELFEIPIEKVVPEARLHEDLDLDSIDAIDIFVRVQNLTGRRIDPEDFKSVRTVNDIIQCTKKLLADERPA